MPGREGGAASSRRLHLHSAGPTPAPRCPGPNQDPAGTGASRAARLTLSLVLSVSWSPPAASPSRGGGAVAPLGLGKPPRCLSSNISRSRAARAASGAPHPEVRAGSLWLAALLPPVAAHSTSSRAAATSTPPPWRRRCRAGSPPPKTNEHQRTSARGRPQRARRHGPGTGSGCVRSRLRAPGPNAEGGDAAERGCRWPGARLRAEAQVGGGGAKKGREGKKEA